MIYKDHVFDLHNNIIVFDERLKLSSRNGTLPESWKEGDTFKLVTGANGCISLIRVE